MMETWSFTKKMIYTTVEKKYSYYHAAKYIILAINTFIMHDAVWSIYDIIRQLIQNRYANLFLNQTKNEAATVVTLSGNITLQGVTGSDMY